MPELTPTAAQPAQPAQGTFPKGRYMATPQTLSNVPEKDTQPLWFRVIMAGATVIAGNARIFAFNKAKNTDPDLTNLEVAGQMPASSEYKISAIEIRPNANCTAPALAAFLASARLKVEVGAKNFEKVNQPAVMFPSLSNVASLSHAAGTPQGLFRFNPGEELYFQASQTFNVYFEADRDGMTLGAAQDLLDFVLVFHGQKAAKVAL